MNKKNGSYFNASKLSEKMRKLTVFHIHSINLQSSHKAHHANLWPHATNFYLSRSVMSWIRQDWYKEFLKMHIMWLFVHCYVLEFYMTDLTHCNICHLMACMRYVKFQGFIFLYCLCWFVYVYVSFHVVIITNQL